MEHFNPNRLLKKYGSEILHSKRFRRALLVSHHGSIPVGVHSIHVARRACRFGAWLAHFGFRVHYDELVHVGLLHDLGMTEKVIFRSYPWHKAYTHPVRSARIAAVEYGATKREQDAILRHMWPICVIPPTTLTGWILIAADKTVTVDEFRRHLFFFRHMRKK